MSTETSQTFLRELDKKLWSAADKLRANLDAAVYKHAVLGLIFLKYVSDSFAMRQREIEAQLRDPESDYYLDPADFGSDSDEAYREAIHDELEERDYYIEKNVFWVPALARWKTLQDSAKLPPGTEIEITNGKKSLYKITSTGKLIDDALDAVEKENPKLKGVLNKTYTQLQIDPANLSSLIDLIASIDFYCSGAVSAPKLFYRSGAVSAPKPGDPAVTDRRYSARDNLGHVYEYFLGQFAIAEGKRAASISRRNPSSRSSSRCSSPTRGAFTIRPWAQAGSSSRASASSKSTAASWATSPSMGRRAIPPPGASPR
jgi:type I restriction enzyme M protein